MEAILSRKVNAMAALGGAALVVLLGVLALGVSSATAGHNYVIPEGEDDAYGEAVCMVTGAAGTADSPVNSVATDIVDDEHAWDRPAPTLMDTDGGSFDFASDTVVCAGSDEGGEVIGTTAGANFSIVAGSTSRLHEAEYTNLVCGTGHAEGSADLFRPPNDPSGLPLTDLKTRFSISFVGGIGPLAITSFEGRINLDDPVAPTGHLDPPPPAPIPNPQDIDTGHGAGVVQIVADEPFDPENGVVPCVTADTEGFFVDAAFEATLSGDEDVENSQNED